MNRSEIMKWLSKCSPMDGSDFAEACDGAVDEIEKLTSLIEEIKKWCEFCVKNEKGRERAFANHLLYVIESEPPEQEV